ncbi:MAG: WYL domain-containing protein [Firmicutes bacterium]|nr:WYL domain-containing protein [Bacillota bacterium]
MPASQNQHAKPLYLMRILLEKTDAKNPMTVNEIIAELAAYNIKAERKSIYSDLELLTQFGLDIETQRDKTTRYYIATRQFELPELKFLVDAVQSSRFISEKKSEELIAKLSSLTSTAQAKQLQRQVYVAGRAKSLNESAYYSIDQIYDAISEGKQISFKYFDYAVNKARVYRKDGEVYQATPVTLCWSDDSYYLIAFSLKYDGFTHYRVDRMTEVSILVDAADGYSHKKFNVSDHIKRVFGMYSGEPVQATLAFENSLVNVVLDHFGNEVMLTPGTEDWFEVNVEVSASPVFLAWMFQFGDRAEIKAPDSLTEAMWDLIQAAARKSISVSHQSYT